MQTQEEHTNSGPRALTALNDQFQTVRLSTLGFAGCHCTKLNVPNHLKVTLGVWAPPTSNSSLLFLTANHLEVSYLKGKVVLKGRGANIVDQLEGCTKAHHKISKDFIYLFLLLILQSHTNRAQK